MFACAECLTPLRSTVDTRDGELLDLVYPCPRCRLHVQGTHAEPSRPEKKRPSRVIPPNIGVHNGKGSCHAPKKNAAGKYVCVVCDVVLRPTLHRPSVYCADHKVQARKESQRESERRRRAAGRVRPRKDR